MLRLVYKAATKAYGTVPTSLKVLVPRAPKSLGLFAKVGGFRRKLRLDKDIQFLVQMFVSGINGCEFCLDFGRMMIAKEGIPMDKFHALPGYRTDPVFSDRERAALVYAEEVTRAKHVADGTFAELQEHFRDWEIVELTILIAIQNFENGINVPLQIGSDGLCEIAERRRQAHGR
jgi:alkylhydroperoxidase family enzyme